MVYTAEPYIAYRQARQAAEAERALGEAIASKSKQTNNPLERYIHF